MAVKAKINEIDPSTLGEKTRVFTLAKMLGVPSKELIIQLDRIGLVKVAQSSLTRDEATALIEAMHSGATDKAPADEPEERIRRRVENNVKNEINQIEEKVERELADFAASINDDLLEDVIPEVTPAPEPSDDEDEDPAAAMPLFMAPEKPTRDTRSSRDASGQSEESDTTSDANGADTAGKTEKPAQTERKTRGRRKAQRAAGSSSPQQESDQPLIDEPVAIKGSTRLEAKRRRRSERREAQRHERHIVSEAEFLARRESVERTMVVREKERSDHPGRVTQVGVLEDGMLVEHFVTSDTQSSMVGNIYLGRVQNVLPSMEAAFIDIGKGRNGVLYAGEVDWKAAGLGGRRRTIEHALRNGDQVLVQVIKDPVGHKGARLSTQISLAGRYLVYVPGGRTAGISRKLPAPERSRLKEILKRVVPEHGGAIIRTAAEGVSEDAIAADVQRLHTQWEKIDERTKKEKSSKGAQPVTLYEEPNMLVKVIRDLFNEDFTTLVVDGRKAWNTVHAYVSSVASDLADRLEKYDPAAHGGVDAFEHYRIDEQLAKALSRKVWLPSGGTLIIERTEAMTVIDVNTGKFTGQGGNLEETVTRNNLEAAEEIVRQMRLRDLGGMIVVDFIDMVLPENQDLVLRRLKEALGRDRTRHQVSEVTSLGLVQMTRKKLGTGLLDTFSTECEACDGRGVIIHTDPVEHGDEPRPRKRDRSAQRPASHPAAIAMHQRAEHTAEQEGEHDAEQQATAQRQEKSIEELADAVIGTVILDDSETEPEADVTSSRRRRRRGGRSRGGKETVERDDKPTESTPEQPIERAETYEEAVEKFNSSPRRRRATRGNSRSDHAPRKSDFEDQKSSSRPLAEPENSQADSPAEQPKQETAQARHTVEVSVARRGRRRRAVRRTVTETEPSTEERSDEEATSQRSSGSTNKATGAAKKRRRGGSTARGKGPSQAQEQPRGETPDAADESRGNQRSSRRRRAVRRSGSRKK